MLVTGQQPQLPVAHEMHVDMRRDNVQETAT